jgi:Cu+-exporting ATPase
MAKAQTIEREERAETAGQEHSVTELTIGGMTCGNCARHVTEALQGVPGVRSAAVNLEGKSASVKWAREADQNDEALVHAVEKAGFEAKVREACACHHDHGERKVAGWQLNLWIGVLGTAPLMLGEWVLGLALTPWFQWFSFIVAAVVQVFAGAQFYRGAWRQLKVGSSNMDTLVALGSTTAFVYSVWALFSGYGGHLYFMESAAIITLISVGHWVESRVSLHASAALRRLLELAPQRARRRNADGAEADVPVSDIRVSELLILGPGDRVPTDGEVVEGESAVDESMLTGESVTVEKKPGSQVYAGTINSNGRLVMRVIATGEETALAHIIAAVQRAQTSRANIQRLGDRVSSVFVPIVTVIALAAGLWWGLAPESAHHVHDWLSDYLWPAHPPVGNLAAGFIIAAAVLIVACPCAMGLATPAAIMAGSNAAAQRGILIRDGVALEKAGEVTTVVFDKTGTLTAGKMSVVAQWDGNSKFEIRNPKQIRSSKFETSDGEALGFRVAAELARHSKHPISEAVAGISPDGIKVTDWKEVRGAGVQGMVGGQMAKIGSLTWLEQNGNDLMPGKEFVEKWTGEGASVIGVAIGTSLAGLFAVKDTVKEGAAEVVRRIQDQGLRVCLVTGDNRATAESIAKQVGIAPENVFAQVRPEEKSEFVKKLQQQGEHVAFVGDGINDAPALEQADLGIAVSRASDIAREAADIILLRSEIEAVPESLGLARATLRTIKQNLFWAFFYNAIGIPLAALGFMSPILCAAAMGFSDIVVIGNALRLRRWSSRTLKR